MSREGVVERWDAPSGGSINGMSLIPDIDGAQVPQTLQISTTAGDRILFSAQVGDQAERVFPLANSGAALAVFENPDSPDIQKITYRRDGEGLTIVLEAGEQAWETHYQACASNGALD